MVDTEMLVFRASLEPKIYRDIELVEACTLYKLAESVVTSFGFDFDHAFGFYSKLKGHFYDSPRRYELFVDIAEGDAGAKGVERTRATEAFPSIGSKMLMLFDYGDEWLFLVELIARKPREARVRSPRVLASVGKAPPQYSYPEEDDDGEEA
jgi:hypothetical protein